MRDSEFQLSFHLKPNTGREAGREGEPSGRNSMGKGTGGILGLGVKSVRSVGGGMGEGTC